MVRRFLLISLAVLLPHAVRAQSPGALAVPPDTTRWTLEGQASVQQFLGRTCLHVDGGVAILKDFELHDGVLDVDAATSATRGFFGFLAGLDSTGSFGEELY